MKIAIIVSEFNKEITDKMLSSAMLHAKKHNISVVNIVRVPGVLEIPYALKKILKKKEVQAAATLGAVIQGKTEHDRLVAFTACEKIVELSLQFEKPVSVAICGPGITKKLALGRAKAYGQRAIKTLIDLKKNLENLD